MQSIVHTSVQGCFLFPPQKELNQIINTSQVNVAAGTQSLGLCWDLLDQTELKDDTELFMII